MLNWQGVKRGLIRVANRPGMPGTVLELTFGVPCPGPSHVCPGIYWQPRRSNIKGHVSMSASFKTGDGCNSRECFCKKKAVYIILYASIK